MSSTPEHKSFDFCTLAERAPAARPPRAWPAKRTAGRAAYPHTHTFYTSSPPISWWFILLLQLNVTFKYLGQGAVYDLIRISRNTISWLNSHHNPSYSCITIRRRDATGYSLWALWGKIKATRGIINGAWLDTPRCLTRPLQGNIYLAALFYVNAAHSIVFIWI